ncbi:MAG: coenzyme F420-0:L-glutamate ligase [Nocardioidaceae bacterium]|nr:coenzyme F420-0:L-glutamate ligase [Nocardioidaceae bacterium]
MPARIEVYAPDGIGEIKAGDDLATTVLEALQASPEVGGLHDGDIVLVTSKVVSKAEGQLAHGDREDHITAETTRLVARRGPTRIVRNRLGLTMAAAGVDASNVSAGSVLLLPEDPDASARAIRAEAAARFGTNLGVIITDTAGRAWREGQTDMAIGAAGVRVLESFIGQVDQHGNELAVTAPAVADEIASAAELAQGKLHARPCALVRGRSDLVLPPGMDGDGARALIRAEGGDLFGYGAREAVVRAVAGEPAAQPPFGATTSAADLFDALTRAGIDDVRLDGGRVRCPAARRVEAAIVAFAYGWKVETITSDGTPDGADLRLLPLSP